MSSTTSLPSATLRHRQQLQEGRQRIQQRFRDGLPSIQTAAALTDLYDGVIDKVWQSALQSAADDGAKPRQLDQLSLVAHGGLGRRDLSPYSDADLMLLTSRASASASAHVATRLVRDLTDAGLDVGFSIRTPGEARLLAWSDIKIYTTLTESRLVTGSQSTFDSFFDRFRVGARRRRNRLNDQAIQARREERRKWGETNYLLRPNVKRSRGGLRDIQLIRWLGFAVYGETTLDRLHDFGVLSTEDYDTLRRAHAFMLRLRHELHFRGGRSQDVLDRPTQLAIAKDWQYAGHDGVLPVEMFMRDYFEHTRGVRYVSAYVGDDNRARSRTARTLEHLCSRKLDDSIRMGPQHIWVTNQKLHAFARRLPDVLRLMQLANHHQRRIEHTTWQSIRQAMQERPTTVPDPPSVRAFLELLSRPGRLASLLRRLHELRILEQLIPAVRRCRGLLQFNAYHKYTVDAHCIRAVEAATEFQSENSAMGRRYRRFRDKTLLHLALLIHDLGKGYEEDHSVVGARIAADVAESFGLDSGTSDTLQWLIANHLLINEVAFRHDLNDADVVHQFAAEVGSIGRLELLLVHTVADLKAVGPDVLSDWKMGLIEDLYLRTRRYFETGNLPGENEPELDSKRSAIIDSLRAEGARPELVEIVDQLPLSLLRHQDTDETAEQLFHVGRWMEEFRGCYCAAHHDAAASAVRFTIVLRLGARRIGAFARATAALSGCGLTIRRANIETIGKDLLWDNFWVTDSEHSGMPPSSRIEEVCQIVRRALDEPDSPLPVPRRMWKTKGNREPSSVYLLPTKVIFDNDTFDHQTILSLFTYDRRGLLSDIAAALSSCNVSIQFAKIDTHLDQIADVFYVTEVDDQPILDPPRQEDIRQAVLEAIAKGEPGEF